MTHLPRPDRTPAQVGGRRRALLVAAALALLAAACGDDGGGETSNETSTTTTTEAPTTSSTSTTSTTTAPDDDPAPTSTEAPLDPACTVFDDDGAIAIPANGTEVEILTALGDAWTAVRDDQVLVDIEGFRYECGGETIFYGAWGAGADPLLSVAISSHPSFVDPAGVGPGQSLADAILAHGGSATARINVDFESREFLEFADGGSPGWSYRVGSPTAGFAGIYPDDTAPERETSIFAADAEITSVWWDPDPILALVPEESLDALGYPEIGTITSLSQGDLSCSASVIPALGGAEMFVTAGFEICIRTDVLDTPSRLVYRVANVSDCESNEPCGQSRTVWLLDDAVVLGDAWHVVSNDDWIITVGHLDSWDGTNGTGDLTYYGCDASLVDNPAASCLALTGGTVVCTNGTCTSTWTNGNFTYSLSSAITDDDEPVTETLRVAVDGAVVLESPGLTVTRSPVG